MNSPGVGPNSSVNQTLPKNDTLSTQQDDEQGKVAFGSGQRDVSEAEPTISLSSVESSEMEDAEVTLLSERSVEDVTTKEPGLMRRALGKLSGALASGSDTVVGVAKGFFFTARHPVKAARVARTIAQEGFESVKKRVVSLPSQIRAHMPAKGISLPSVKSIFSRSAQSASPSVSLQSGLEKISQASSESAAKLADTREALQDARDELANIKNLNKLLDNPVSFFKPGNDLTVQWGDSEPVMIEGSGIDRANQVKKAVALAVANRADIRAAYQDVKNEIKELKLEKDSQKEEVREQTKAARKDVSRDEKTQYASSKQQLNQQREQLKAELKDAKKALKKVRADYKSTVRDERESAKAEIKAEKLVLKALKSAAQTEKKQFKKDVEKLQRELKTHNKAIADYESKAEKSTGHALSAVMGGMEAARIDAAGLKNEIDALTLQFENSKAESEVSIQKQEAIITKQQELLETIQTNAELESPLTENITRIEEALKQNAQELKDLRNQHPLDQQAIKKTK
jgi:chromosome segregation ATPase